MACERLVPTNVPNGCNNGCIYRTIARIEQLQKEATIENICEGCEGPLNPKSFNTKPCTFYYSNGAPVTVDIPNQNNNTTSLFRIETLQGDCVIVRLLDKTDSNTTCTNYTAIISIPCICCMQCFDPICCDPCTKEC